MGRLRPKTDEEVSEKVFSLRRVTRHWCNRSKGKEISKGRNPGETIRTRDTDLTRRVKKGTNQPRMESKESSLQSKTFSGRNRRNRFRLRGREN